MTGKNDEQDRQQKQDWQHMPHRQEQQHKPHSPGPHVDPDSDPNLDPDGGEDEDDTPGAEEWKLAGDVCLAKQDHEGAMECYFEALRLQPDHPAARYNLALVHLESDRFVEAAALLRGVLASRPGDPEVLTSLGWAQLWGGDCIEAAKTFRRAIMYDPAHAPAQVGLGWAQLAKEPPALGRAADAFAKAIAMECEDPEAYYGLATVCELRDEATQALPLLEDVLRRWPDDVRALDALARIHLGDGDWKLAASYLMRLAHLDRENPDYPLRLARLFEARGEGPRATLFWRHYRELVPESEEAAVALGEQLLAADRPEEAIESLELAATKAPGSAVARARLGHAFFYARRYDEAITEYVAAATLEPDTAGHHYNLGNAYLEAGQNVKAAQAMQRALALDPGLSDARVGLGWAYYAQRELAAARTCFEWALRQAPDDVAALDGLGSTAWLEGRPQVALELIERARAFDPAGAGLGLKLGMILEELGQLGPARKVLQEVVSGSFASERAAQALARIEALLGRGSTERG